MSTLEIELQELRERNNELVKKVQYWKMTAAQRENEKLDLMKENNDLRLKLSRLRSGGAAHARKLDAEIQSASKQALTHLVQASSAVTRTVQLAKTYMQERQELETTLPRWSSISSTPSSEKVHRVMPMLIGGQSIQPVVSLSRTLVNVNNLRSTRSPNTSQNHSFSERGPLPMHMLQDLYIPLTRIDANGLPVNSMEVDRDEEDADEDNSTEDLGLNDSGDQTLHESQTVSDAEQFDDTRRLDVVEEDAEPEDDPQPTPKPRTENPLEGPSWLLDRPSKSRKTKTLEPDSTTECEEPAGAAPAPARRDHTEHVRLSPACVFSPTVRRRKRTSSPRPAARRNSNNGRILKVLVSKLRLDEDDASPPKRPSLNKTPKPRQSPGRRGSTNSPMRDQRDSSPVTSPTRRPMKDKSPSLRLSRDVHLLSFDAPSPNGATTSHVVVSESKSPADEGGSGEPAGASRRVSSHEGRNSRDTKHDGRNSRDTKHDATNSRDTKHDGRNSRDTKHDGCNTRDTKHDSTNSQDTKHDATNSRDTKHDASNSRDTKHDASNSRDTKHDASNSRDTKHDASNSGDTRHDSRGSHDSDSGSDMAGEGRARRARKAVTYKEKPLNRKMRR